MIVGQIIGGLGNQMFQYAAARALALAHGAELRLDTTGFDAYPRHQGYQLKQVFGINNIEISRRELLKYYGWRIAPICLRLAKRWPHFPFSSPNILIEPHFDYCTTFTEMPSDTYLQGYWQSERYFSPFSHTIRNDFQFPEPNDPAFVSLKARIQNENSIFLHIRRGDYLSNPATFALHGVCSLDYYSRAISIISSRVSQPVFYVFSDDLNWANDNLSINFPLHFVEGNSGLYSFRDLHLMTLCRHSIIANSSFSWWGAWLNTNPGKIVIAPRRWFATRPQPMDLYPASWILI